MPQFTHTELKKKDFLVVTDKSNGQVQKVIFPNGLQVGLDSPEFNKGIVLQDLGSSPQDTRNALYAVNGVLHYNGSAVNTGGGGASSLTVEEADGNPSVSSVTKIKVSNGTLTDDGSGTVTITTGGGGGGGGAPTDAQYVVLATDGDLSAERVLTMGTGLDSADGGAGGNVTVSLDLTEVIASDGANRVLTSDGDGTLTAESSVTIDGTDLGVAAKIFHIGDTDTFINFTDDDINFQAGNVNFIDLTQGTTSETTLNEAGANVDLRVESQGEDEAIFLDASENELYINKGETAFTTIIGSTNDEAIRVGAAGVVLNEDGHATNDFRVESNTREYAVFVDASTDQVILGAKVAPSLAADVGVFVSGVIGGKDVASGDASKGTATIGGDLVVSGNVYLALSESLSSENTLAHVGHDVNFFVSGAIGSHAGHGTAAFGGNTVISGGLVVGNESYPSNTTANIRLNGHAGYSRIATKDNSNTYIQFSDSTDIGPTSGEISFTNDGSNTAVFVKNYAHFNPGKTARDFRVDGDNRSYVLLVTGTTDQLLILSGGAEESYDETSGGDVAFYVSGAVDSRGTSDRGSAVFGGDVVVSGTLSINRAQAEAGNVVTVTSDGRVGIGSDAPDYALDVAGNIGVDEYIYHNDDANTFIHFADDAIGITAGGEQLITISESGQDIVKIGDGGDVDFQVRTLSDDNTLYVEGATDRVGIGTNAPSSILHIKETGPTLTLQRENNSNASTINFIGASANTANSIIHDSSTNDLVFKTFNGSTVEEILRLGDHYGVTNRQVIFLSGSAMNAGAMHPRECSDIAFFVSGAIGSRGVPIRGAAVFGGDVQVSGSLYVSDPGVGRDVVFYGEDAGAIGMVWDADLNEHGTLVLGQNGNGVDFIAYGSSRAAVMEWDQSVDTLELQNAKFLQATNGARHATTMEQNDETLDITHVNRLTTKPMEVKFHGLVKDHQDAKILAAIDAQSVLANEIF